MNLREFSEELYKAPMTKGLAEQVKVLEERYGAEYTDIAESLLEMCDRLELDPIDTARKYIYDYLKQLSYFLKHKEYGHNDYDEIRRQIYDDEDTMLDTYMPGLLMSYAYTTILYEKNDLYLNQFLPRLPENACGVEVGFGEGFYIWEALSKREDITIKGFDISPYAIQFASRVMKAAGVPDTRYNLEFGNLFEGLNCDDGVMDFATFAEVIEHIPQPEVGIKEVCRLLKTGGILYLTTVIDSNHMDHISNFASPDVVVDMLADAGMKVVAKKIYHVTDDFPDSNDISVGLAFVAQKM